MSFDAIMPPYNAGDPNASFLSSSCLDFLLIELVPMAYRVTNELETAAAANSNVPPPPSTSGGSEKEGGGGGGGAVSQNGGGLAPPSLSSAAGAGGGGTSRKMDEEEERDAVFYRLETLGYRVGQGLVERCVFACGLARGARDPGRAAKASLPPCYGVGIPAFLDLVADIGCVCLTGSRETGHDSTTPSM